MVDAQYGLLVRCISSDIQLIPFVDWLVDWYERGQFVDPAAISQ